MEIVSEILAGAQRDGRKNLLESEAKTACQAYGIPVTKFNIAREQDEAVKLAEQLSFPVVLKILSPDIIHKSDIGGVIIGLNTSSEVIEGYRKILENTHKHCPGAKIVGVLVQEMAPPSTEVIIGAIRDTQFGPTVMFGLGGIFAEVLNDVAFRIAPVSKHEADLMITEIKAYPVLKGYRNHPTLDTEIVADIIVNTSKLIMSHPLVKELDLNPVLIYERGAQTVDARIILE
ncbi:MAG: acetate--CoA ligase family protein [Candidatus Bathyarchaeota archaeon]|jgi:acetyl-CoA synthetase (ADP-forming)|nr:MAG: acetate--CoA ligase family protein [Candidatus Bathyarchaeota archaeon]